MIHWVGINIALVCSLKERMGLNESILTQVNDKTRYQYFIGEKWQKYLDTYKRHVKAAVKASSLAVVVQLVIRVLFTTGDG